jgi:hypothetical protein
METLNVLMIYMYINCGFFKATQEWQDPCPDPSEQGI